MRRAGRDRADFPFTLTTVCDVAPDADVAWERAAPGIAYLESSLRSQPLRAGDLTRADCLVVPAT